MCCGSDELLGMGNAGHGPLLEVAVPNVAETNSDLILSSGGHNFVVLSILSSGDMSYELDATLILDLCSWKPIIDLYLILLLNSLASEHWPIIYPEHKELFINIKSHHSYSQTNFLLRSYPLLIMGLPKNLLIPVLELWQSMSAIVGDLDPYPWVFQFQNAILGSVWVSATRWLGATLICLRCLYGHKPTQTPQTTWSKRVR